MGEEEEEWVVIISLSETPAHLKNIKSIIARTFHENEHYNSNKGKLCSNLFVTF